MQSKIRAALHEVVALPEAEPAGRSRRALDLRRQLFPFPLALRRDLPSFRVGPDRVFHAAWFHVEHSAISSQQSGAVTVVHDNEGTLVRR